MTRLIQLCWLVVVAMVVGGGVFAGYRVMRAEVAAAIYKDRLAELVTDYESLRGTYNAAVRKTAVTELVVTGGRLAVRVRSAAGLIREIPTPFDPKGEVYVDYVMLDGRLWIRRVFDANTPPAMGVVIDPDVNDPDWDAPNARHGKAVYRTLAEGRWVVTVTGDGSLGLARAGDVGGVELSPPPMVHDFETIAAEADSRADEIAAADVWRRLVNGG
jgi:hypothetical protein